MQSFAYLDFSKGVIYHPRNAWAAATADDHRRRRRKQTGHFCFCPARAPQKWAAKLWPRFALNLLASPHWNDVSYGRSFILTLITQFVPLALINLHVWFIIEAGRETPRDLKHKQRRWCSPNVATCRWARNSWHQSNRRWLIICLY